MKTKGGLLLVSALFVALPAMADLKDEPMAREKAGWTAWSKNEGEWYRDAFTEDAVLAVAGAEVATGRDKIIADTNNHDCEMKSFELMDAKLRQVYSVRQFPPLLLGALDRGLNLVRLQVRVPGSKILSLDRLLAPGGSSSADRCCVPET